MLNDENEGSLILGKDGGDGDFVLNVFNVDLFDKLLSEILRLLVRECFLRKGILFVIDILRLLIELCE